MNRFWIDDAGWLTIHTRTLRHITEDIALLQTLRSVVFRQMLEPPTWDGAHTIIEGRPMAGSKERLRALGFEEMIMGTK